MQAAQREEFRAQMDAQQKEFRAELEKAEARYEKAWRIANRSEWMKTVTFILGVAVLVFAAIRAMHP